MPYYPSSKRYEDENILGVRVKFNRRTEPELVERVEREPKKATYLKRLVREDIQREREQDGEQPTE